MLVSTVMQLYLKIKKYIKAKGGPKYELGETRHHAEQRAVNSLKPDEEFAGLSPTKDCCDKCREVLIKSGDIEKVLRKYQFMNKKDQDKYLKENS